MSARTMVSQRDRWLATFLAVALLLAVGWIFWRAWWEPMHALSVREKSLAERGARARGLLAQSGKIATRWSQAQEQDQRMPVFMGKTRSEAVAKLSTVVESTMNEVDAEKKRCVIMSRAPEAGSNVGADKVTLSVHVQCANSQLLQFLHRLENQRPMTAIESMIVQTNEVTMTGMQKGILDVDLVLSGYTLEVQQGSTMASSGLVPSSPR